MRATDVRQVGIRQNVSSTSLTDPETAECALCSSLWPEFDGSVKAGVLINALERSLLCRKIMDRKNSDIVWIIISVVIVSINMRCTG